MRVVEDEVPDVMDTEPREDEEEEEKFSIKYQEYIDTAKAIVYRIRSEGWKNSMQQSDIENEVLVFISNHQICLKNFMSLT